MGLFDSIGDFFTSTAKKVVKGVKRGAEKVVKGAKKLAKPTMKGLKAVGKALQEPAKFIKKHDPLAKVMGGAGFLSPISLATDIALAPVSGVGYMSQLAGDRKLQKKLASGDVDTILDTGFAGLGIAGAPALGRIGKKIGKKLAKKGAKLGRKLAKKVKA